MAEKRIILDGGTTEENIRELKAFFGLREDQSFDEIEIEDEDEED